MFRVFITNLGKYNEGELVGKWLDLPCEDIELELASIGVSDEPDENGNYYEEYFITDFENDYNYKVGEYDSLDELNMTEKEILDAQERAKDDCLSFMEYIYSSGKYRAIIEDCIEEWKEWYKDEYALASAEDVLEKNCEELSYLED